MNKRIFRHGVAAALALCVGLTGCGGGGGGGDSSVQASSNTQPEPLPQGATIDISHQNLFPFHQGDSWEYSKLVDAVSSTSVVTRTVVGDPLTAEFILREQDGSGSEDTRYSITSSGLVINDPLGVQQEYPALYGDFPTYLEYFANSYTVNALREIGMNIGTNYYQFDLDKDGLKESVEVKFGQVFKGFEIIQVLGVDTQVAHFSNSVTFTFFSGAMDEFGPLRMWQDVYTSEDYFAPGIGLVRSRRSHLDPYGVPVDPPYTLNLRAATVGGVSMGGSAN